ncbi:[histone H3]-dimethyl-L-lysine(36) demethylase [Malassezia brasiliensis]|uniref:[histone H3]-dimethyl-L-lysine(36) demethylase n=1 Tax=Malassezia brasiliensis TaxID=1821822 RepID=A0AAF0IRM1_9BASI|nr:[histone H3]-dimethyl-L-lysine(36) demethylase [Malassezia brasiliensis]
MGLVRAPGAVRGALHAVRHYAAGPDAARRKADVFRNRKARHFVDHVVVDVQAGHGGDGCVAFHREKYVQMGPAGGGNGGAGGSVYVRADPSLHSLARVHKQAVAKNGTHGQGGWLHGRRGADYTIHVPVGTTVRSLGRTWNEREAAQADYLADLFAPRRTRIDLEATPALYASRSAVWRHFPRYEDENYARAHFGSAEDKLQQELRAQRKIARGQRAEERSAASASARAPADVSGARGTDAGWAVDLAQPTPPDDPGVLLARGGSGGLGNPHFVLDQYRSPKVATRGAPGESLLVSLEYKQPSDVGLVGLPNAGKSTLLRCLSNADAEVGAYAFTTLRPNLGVLRLDEGGAHLDAPGAAARPEALRLTVADLPGLVADAADDRGLGHDFLRHVERCGRLVYVVDLGPTNVLPSQDVATLNRELEAYRRGLSARVALVVANKADLLGDVPAADARAKLARLQADVDLLFAPRHVPVVPVAAALRQNVAAVVRALRALAAPPDAVAAARGAGAA